MSQEDKGCGRCRALDIVVAEEREKLEKVRSLVLDDVPHQYQKRLLEALGENSRKGNTNRFLSKEVRNKISASMKKLKLGFRDKKCPVCKSKYHPLSITQKYCSKPCYFYNSKTRQIALQTLQELS